MRLEDGPAWGIKGVRVPVRELWMERREGGVGESGVDPGSFQG